MHIYITKAPHAPLFQRFCVKAGDFITLGRKGTYTQEDKNGAEYRCLGLGKKGNKISYSSDLRCSLFYPENTFIYGETEDRKTLSHEQIEKFKQKFYDCHTQRCLLPRGYERGTMTFWNAVYYVPVDFQPNWYKLEERVKNLFPSAEIYRHDNEIEVSLDFLPE